MEENGKCVKRKRGENFHFIKKFFAIEVEIPRLFNFNYKFYGIEFS